MIKSTWSGRVGEVMTRRPFNEWTFTHMNRLMPAETIRRGTRARPLGQHPRPADLTYRFDGRDHTIGDLNRRTFTTALVVLHRGAVVHESYPGWFAGPAVRCQLFSISKSLVSLLVGAAVADGVVGGVDDPVTTYLPGLTGTAYDGPTLAHLLDMTSGAGGVELWDLPDSPIRGYVAAVLGEGDLRDVVRAAPRTAEPGERFNYSTLGSQVLGWVLEAATGRSLARYASERLWSRIGAEHDAYFLLTRNAPRSTVAAGTFNATARDTARLGLLMARGGRVGDEQVVPAAWVDRALGRREPALAAGALGVSGWNHYGYANQWWTVAGEPRAVAGIGAHGQYLYVDPDADVVIVKCGAWPVQDDESLDRECITALRHLAAHLG